LEEDIIWDIIRTDIPRLLPALRNSPNALGEDSKEHKQRRL